MTREEVAEALELARHRAHRFTLDDSHIEPIALFMLGRKCEVAYKRYKAFDEITKRYGAE